MSRRAKETLAVQLFPFLAVLVCTMGSLIFLLLVTTRQIRQRAVAFAAYQTAAKELAAVESTIDSTPTPEPVSTPDETSGSAITSLPDLTRLQRSNEIVERHQLALAERERDLDELKSKWQLKAGRLRNDRERLRQVVSQNQTQTELVIRQTDSMKADLESLASKLEKLKSEATEAAARASDDAERMAIERQISELKIRLRAAQVEQASATNDQFQVVPFDPQTGTTRRPILIECTAKGITFLPEGITITATDLQGFTPRMNPLAAGTGALVNYWNEWNSRQPNPRSEPDPYVLLLVRPDGAVAYYVAMRMLEPIRTAHGYELIDDETTLKLPDLDPAAKSLCQAAVERLFAEREYVSRQAVNNGMGGTVFGGTGTRVEGGKRINLGTGLGSNGDKSLSTGKSGENLFSLTDVTGGSQEVGNRSWERIENFEGHPRHRKGTASADGRSSDKIGDSESESESSGVLDSNTREKSDGSSSLGGSRIGSKSASGNSPQTTNHGMGSGTERRSKSGKFEDRISGEDPLTDTPNEFGEREPGMPIGKRPQKKKPAAAQSSEQADVAENDQPDSDASPSDDLDNSSTRNRSGKSSSRHEISDNDSSPYRNPNGSKLSVLSSHQQRRSGKSKTTPDKQLEPEMLSGRHWGISDADASIGFEREVRVDVFEDRMVLAEKYEIPLGDETRQETFEHFVSSLDKYSREWGRPPHGFYWSPRLKFIVKPEATGHYEQINALMLRAGLPTAHEFAQSSDAIEFGKDPRFLKLRQPKSASKANSGGTR